MWCKRITMGSKKQLLLFLCFTCFLQNSDGQCQIGDSVLSNYEQQQRTIQDIFRGHIISSGTTNIVAISNINYGGGLANSPSYLDITLVDSVFTVQTSSAFDQYEENETAMSIPVTINFACNGGTSSILLLVINIDDTNNNYPEFIPRNEFEFVVAPPLPPGFLITGCLNEITVKDIDLTTSSIIFEIEENPYFQIEYDAEASNDAGPKMFKARLSTTSFIRTLKEPIALRITATDVDDTGDPPLSVSGMIRISGDTEFEFPEEPVFSQTFYFATYNDKHELIQQDTIFLQQGFDEYVNFTLDGEYKSYFNAIPDGNQVSLIVVTPLPTDVLLEKQIYLIVRADREYTSGDTATVVINLPAEIPLLFESALYEGLIVDDALQLAPLVLSQGYEDSTVTARIVGEYSSNFTATVQGNLVTVTMGPLTNSVIERNSFISIPIVASKDRSEATSIVTLEIIKDDNITPVFDESIYIGSYDNVDGLSIGEITILQGYDNTVTVELHGEHKDLFQLNHIGTSIQLTTSTIPPELYEEKHITLIIEAAKPRTVGAKATIMIKLPAPRELTFEEPLYLGTINNDELWHQTILLSEGYDENVDIIPIGEYVTYFNVNNEDNRVIITLSQALPETVVTQNSNIALTLTASGLNAVPTTTSVLFDIIKEDATTPVLNQKIYQETYRGPTDFEIGNIFLTQGFDSNVTFKLDDSEHAQYFEINNMDNLATIRLRSAIPVDVIFNEKVLVFNVIAEKPLTVGSHAAVIIRFPEELTEPTIMRFSENSYVGALDNDDITFAEEIILSAGYVVETDVELYGDLKDYFRTTLKGATVIVTLRSPIPETSIPSNRIIVLEIHALAPPSTPAHATLVIEYVVDDDGSSVVELIFAEPFYTGTYTDAEGLTFTTPISLTNGYDEDVRFALNGDDSRWFTLVGSGNSQVLSLLSPIPAAVLQNNQQLVFVVEAIRPGSTTTTATIVISLTAEYTDGWVLGFDQITYRGSLENNQVSTATPIIISEGYAPGVQVTLYGDLKDYFETTLQGATVIVTLRSPIPETSIPANRIIVFEIQASAPPSTPAHATLVIEYVVDDDGSPVVELIFAEPFYTGTYTDAEGLTFTTPISLTDGYDEDVRFALNGDDSRWFTLVGSGNSQVLSLLSPIPAAVLQNNQQLVFVVEAIRPGSTTTAATIVISLTAEYTDGWVLGFDQITYRGSLENNQVSTATPIIISEGYAPGVQVTLHGDLKDYFETTLQGATVIVTLRSPIPETSIPANRIIVFEIQASAPPSTPAHATLVIEYVVDDDGSPVVELIFAEPFYTGTYTDAEGLTFTTPISLTDGYDEDVRFALNGDDSRWFTLTGSGNSQVLSLLSPIPAAVLQNNQQLVFVVEAIRPGSTTTAATIVISLTAEYTDGWVLGFDQITYRGSLENNQVSTATPIIISEGYAPGVQVTLYGDLKDYFETTLQGATVIVTLRSPIPENSIPANRIIVFEIQASAPPSTPAHATLVIEYVVDDDGSPVVELIFAEPFYTGTYTDAEGLTFTTPISLTDGYDEDVRFALNGDDSRWFTLVGSGNSLVLSLLSPIPAAVLQNNQQLVFVVEAIRPGSTTTTATIVISLTAEYTDGWVLGFDQITYRGSLENNQVSTATPIIISEGYAPGVQVTLHGDLKDYFETTLQGATVIVTLRSPIPETSIPANRIIVFEIQASAPPSTPAHATLVIEYVVDDDGSPVVELIFAEPFYTGTYTDAEGLTFTTPISLTDGYDEDVRFALNGDDSRWFTLTGSGNSQVLSLLSPIPAAVLQNNQQLVFVVEAIRPGSTTTAATIVISLTAEYTDGWVLGFDQITYRGSLENNQVSTATPIIISEGYAPGVQVTLYGDLKDYFETTLQGATVIVTLRSPIPENSIPANRIIVFEIQASAPPSTPAHATLVIEYVVDDDGSPVVELIFAEPFYTGTYTDAEGLTFTTPISLTDGYDEDVRFALNGDDSRWFTLVGSGNSLVLSLLSPIPAAVLQNNQQLVFVVEAIRPGSTTTTATIVISLTAEYTDELVLGFDQITYRGSLENNQVSTATPIIISEGYAPGVQVTLHGDLKDYFETTLQGATVIVTLRSPIPETSIPANRIIVFEIQASAPPSTPAHATLVIEYVVDDDGSPVVELIFAEPFYTGTYTDAEGLTFTTPISLTDGYDEDVRFALNGDDSRWFTLTGSENSQVLSLLSPIPAAVLQNNQQLVFVVEAIRPGSTTTTATIVISLTAEYTDELVLGFDQITYRGSLENNQVSTATPIIISEGYAPGVQVTLHGDLKDYFETTLQGATVIVTLRSPIPETSIPANRIIVFEIQASAPPSTPAHATLVIEYVVDDDGSPVVELIFAEPFYTGTYTDAEGLTFTTPISLTDGYDEDVRFALNGDDSRWFTLVGSGNSQVLSLLSPIPAAVLQNNQQLVFVVEAIRPGSTTTTATIVISLTAEYTDGLVLGFDQITYRGSLENNQVSTATPIIISEGYAPGLQVTLHGDLNDYFETTLQGATVIVTLRSPIPETSIPANRIIVFEIQASAPPSTPAHATLVIEYVVDDDGSPVVELIFAEPFYTGKYTDAEGLTFTTPISLTDGYDEDVRFALNGDDSRWFTLVGSGNSQVLSLLSPIPAAVLQNNQQLVFVVEAIRPGSTTTTATIVISLTADAQTESKESFEKVLYEGVIRNGVVYHETIRVTEFNGNLVKLNGVHSSLFEAEYKENSSEVTVRAAGSLTLPAHITHLPLELMAGSAEAVLLLDISQSGVSTPIVVTFSSSSFAIRVDNTVTGAVGQVQATADNGEAVRYSLQMDNVHLQERLSIDDDGTLWISDPVNSGIYTFQVVATTIYTDETGTATVFLTSEAIAVCGDDNVMPPLIVLNRDEEEDHYNLYSSNDGCHFSLSNRWPLNQTWVYVDETGLHTRAIDREHPSIAFMTLSQVQVEITLHCDTDETRVKRSITYDSPDPYDYGTNNWILVDTIPYDKLSRRSLVNLIVNDINDNAPIFVDKEREPIAVGYPVAGLEEIVLPRSLAELQATDADIGENAALVYSSSEPALAVSPLTGFVHIRDGATLENNSRLTVRATDLNGQGLTGSIDIVVKILDESNILVVTVRDEFLNNEADVLARMSESLGYEIKVLRSVVISEDEIDEESTRKKRDILSATGASLQLYVYGLIDREPVSVERLITDITNAEVAQVNIASTVSLEDHLAGQEICVMGRDTGLLAATIVLSVLLFIVLVLIAVWFFLRWRRNRKYGRFSDTDSFTSQNEPKPVEVVLAPNPKPRLNIEELKKSERRLQEMLDAPIEEVTIEPTPSRKNAVVDMPTFTKPNAPIVIQSMDKLKDPSDDISEDEFGEIKNPKPKSIVTFNENVEKIIHVEDDDVAEASPTSSFEIYKL